MCGILALATLANRSLRATEQDVLRMRDELAHRGPDGAGVLVREGFALAHRRLSIIDPSEGGHQPMMSRDGRYGLVYNGELYNEPELRRDLAQRGILFRTQSDTETLLAALVQWGPEALVRLRGMYAFAFVDFVSRKVLLARDPLGIKPLYFAIVDGHELVAASEIPAVLAHPSIRPMPDLITVSSYLTTIRTTLGHRTLFEGVHVLEPGQAMQMDFSSDAIHIEAFDSTILIEQAVSKQLSPLLDDDQGDLARVRAAIEESVRRHLRSDVPLCSLLSGGVDSTIIANLASRHVQHLRTFAAGAGDSEDLPFARMASECIHSRHAEAVVDRAMFDARWPEMVQSLGVPLSTPNEVAINAVARAIRAAGCKVALSGEGADELFAGYDALMDACVQVPTSGPDADPGAFHLRAAAWVGLEAKPALLQPEILSEIGQDVELLDAYRGQFTQMAERGLHGLDAHLAFQRRVNLVGLLQRLDTAMMLEGVEGRTPFADVAVAALATSISMRLKYQPPVTGSPVEPGGGTAVMQRTLPRTKLILRHSCSDLVPETILNRPKASFPLPFKSWMGTHATVLRTSGLSQVIFTPAAIETIATQPQNCWQFAWPAINLALWGQRWWG